MEIKTKITCTNRLTTTLLGFISSVVQLESLSIPCFPKPPPTAQKTWSGDLFPVESNYTSPRNVFSPQQDPRRQPLKFACYTRGPSFQYQHMFCYPCGSTSVDRTCRGLPFSCGILLLWALSSFPSLGLPSSPLQPVLAHSALLITTMLGVPASSVFLPAADLNLPWYCSNSKQEP